MKLILIALCIILVVKIAKAEDALIVLGHGEVTISISPSDQKCNLSSEERALLELTARRDSKDDAQNKCRHFTLLRISDWSTFESCSEQRDGRYLFKYSVSAAFRCIIKP